MIMTLSYVIIRSGMNESDFSYQLDREIVNRNNKEEKSDLGCMLYIELYSQLAYYYYYYRERERVRDKKLNQAANYSRITL